MRVDENYGEFLLQFLHGRRIRSKMLSQNIVLRLRCEIIEIQFVKQRVPAIVQTLPEVQIIDVGNVIVWDESQILGLTDKPV